MGQTLIVLGLILVAAGLFMTWGGRLPLPGDIVIRGKNSTFYFPVVTCLLLSAVLTLAMWLFGRR